MPRLSRPRWTGQTLETDFHSIADLFGLSWISRRVRRLLLRGFSSPLRFVTSFQRHFELFASAGLFAQEQIFPIQAKLHHCVHSLHSHFTLESPNQTNVSSLDSTCAAFEFTLPFLPTPLVSSSKLLCFDLRELIPYPERFQYQR